MMQTILTERSSNDFYQQEKNTHEALCKILARKICCLIQSIFELKIKPVF